MDGQLGRCVLVVTNNIFTKKIKDNQSEIKTLIDNSWFFCQTACLEISLINIFNSSPQLARTKS